MTRLAWTLALVLGAAGCATVPRPPDGAAPSEVVAPAATTDPPVAASPAQPEPSGVKAPKKQGTKAAPKTKAKAKTPSPGGGDVTERLARIEKMLTAVVQKLDAGGAKSKVAAGDDALQKKAAALKETASRMETERNELKSRVKGLEREVAALREEAEALRAKLAETK